MSMTENEKLQKAIEEEKELYEIMKDRYEKLGLESCKDRAEEHELNIKWLEEIQQYRAIGTIEEFKALKEKNEPKKIKGIRHTEAICPSCLTELYETYWAFGGIHYCSNCGQTIDWQ